MSNMEAISEKKYLESLDIVRRYNKQIIEEIPSYGLSKENIKPKSFDLLSEEQFQKYIVPILNTPVRDLDLPITVINPLIKISSFRDTYSNKYISNYKIITVRDLLAIPKRSLLCQRGIGAVNVKKITDYLDQYGLKLKN